MLYQYHLQQFLVFIIAFDIDSGFLSLHFNPIFLLTFDYLKHILSCELHKRKFFTDNFRKHNKFEMPGDKKRGENQFISALLL